MIGPCPYLCDNKTDLGYCRSTVCVNPDHKRVIVTSEPIVLRTVDGKIVGTDSPESALSQNLQDGNYKAAEEQSQPMALKMMAAWGDGDLEKLRRYINRLEVPMRRAERIFCESGNDLVRAAYILGKLQGTRASFSHVLYCDSKTKEARREHHKRLQYIEHFTDVVKAVYSLGPSDPDRIREETGLEKDELEKVLQKAMEEDILACTVSGSYRVFSFTDRGLRYAHYLLNNAPSLETSVCEYIPISEFACKIGRSAVTVRQMCEGGKIPGAIKIGRGWVVPRSTEYKRRKKRGE